jgi:hypothetical protein
VPISRGEAKKFLLTDADIDLITRKVGDNRNAFLREAGAIRQRRVDQAFKDLSKIGETPSASERVTIKAKPRTTKPIPGDVEKQMLQRQQARVRARWPEVKQRWIDQMAEATAQQKRQIQWLPFKPGQLTPAAMSKLIADWKRMRPSKALNQMREADLLAVVAVADPQFLSDTLSKTRGQSRTQAYEDLANDLQGMTTTSQRAITDALAATQTEVETETKTKAKEKTETETKIKTKTEPRTEVVIRTERDKERPPKTPKPPKPPKVPRVPKPPNGPPPDKGPPPKIILLPSRDQEKEEERRATFKGAITWRQGFGWWALKAPYSTKDDVAFFMRPPQGARVVKGPESAYRTIQTLTGKPPARLVLDMGIMDVTIQKPTRTAGKRGSITFRPDKGQRSTGNISLRTNLVSTKRGQVFHTRIPGDTLLSRRPLGRAKRR